MILSAFSNLKDSVAELCWPMAIARTNTSDKHQRERGCQKSKTWASTRAMNLQHMDHDPLYPMGTQRDLYEAYREKNSPLQQKKCSQKIAVQ